MRADAGWAGPRPPSGSEAPRSVGDRARKLHRGSGEQLAAGGDQGGRLRADDRAASNARGAATRPRSPARANGGPPAPRLRRRSEVRCESCSGGRGSTNSCRASVWPSRSTLSSGCPSSRRRSDRAQVVRRVRPGSRRAGHCPSPPRELQAMPPPAALRGPAQGRHLAGNCRPPARRACIARWRWRAAGSTSPAMSLGRSDCRRVAVPAQAPHPGGDSAAVRRGGREPLQGGRSADHGRLARGPPQHRSCGGPLRLDATPVALPGWSHIKLADATDMRSGRSLKQRVTDWPPPAPTP